MYSIRSAKKNDIDELNRIAYEVGAGNRSETIVLQYDCRQSRKILDWRIFLK
jgi:hypothetical protein